MNHTIPRYSGSHGRSKTPARGRLFGSGGFDDCYWAPESPESHRGRNRLVLPEDLPQREALDRFCPQPVGVDLAELSLGELADHIESTHHRYLKCALPRPAELAEKVIRVHGNGDEQLEELEALFQGFARDLLDHLKKEETILFPMCRRLDEASRSARPLGGSVRGPIRVMAHEHEHAESALRQMRRLSDGFSIPLTACDSHRAMLYGLDELEDDLLEHLRKENEALFPAAIAAEARVEVELGSV